MHVRSAFTRAAPFAEQAASEEKFKMYKNRRMRGPKVLRMGSRATNALMLSLQRRGLTSNGERIATIKTSNHNAGVNARTAWKYSPLPQHTFHFAPLFTRFVIWPLTSKSDEGIRTPRTVPNYRVLSSRRFIVSA